MQARWGNCDDINNTVEGNNGNIICRVMELSLKHYLCRQILLGHKMVEKTNSIPKEVVRLNANLPSSVVSLWCGIDTLAIRYAQLLLRMLANCVRCGAPLI